MNKSIKIGSTVRFGARLQAGRLVNGRFEVVTAVTENTIQISSSASTFRFVETLDDGRDMFTNGTDNVFFSKVHDCLKLDDKGHIVN